MNISNEDSRRPALRVALLCIAVTLTVGAALRIAIIALLVEHLSTHERLFALLLGAAKDLLVGAVLCAPIAGMLALSSERWISRRVASAAAVGVYSALTVFGAFVEFFFFEEFDARFNNIAIDYVLFPKEVIGNVFESYNVPLFVGLALAAGAAIPWATRGLFVADPQPRRTLKRRLGYASVAALTSTAGIGLLAAIPTPTLPNREANELASNGLVQLVRAFWSAGLDYELYYRTLPGTLARERALEVLGATVDDGGSLVKVLQPRAPRRTPQQVVVVIEESLGSDFVGSSGEAQWPVTPELDRWMPQGLALTHLIANGNRTVRGLEGILCSFVPLPGDSIVKRDKSEEVATLGRVFASAGYSTAFFYGGYGVFDFMKPFLCANGYADFIEQPDYPEDAFRTIWGVADEHIFDALLERQRADRTAGRKLFATLLSVSNHKPYRVPPGRPGYTGEHKPTRQDAVRYADWCLGRYLDSLRAEGFLENTLVLIVGDHGARVYGSEAIPMRSYRIPALFVGGAELAGQKLERLCSQIDLAPTLLDLCGIEAQASFLGHSVLGLPADGGRAWVHHNRDVGLVTDDALVVLGLRKSVAFYRRSGRDSLELARVSEADADDRLRDLADDATGVFQTAYELYESRGLKVASATPRK